MTKTETAAESAARYIEGLILEGTLGPGDPLLPERELAQRLNVSRPTLRQGMKILEDRGLIVSGGGGRTVAPLGRDMTDPLLKLMAAHAEVVDDYLEFRATTEKMAASLAAARANEVDRTQLTACMEKIDRAHAEENQQAEADADVDLHIALYEASHNLVLLHIMRAISGMLRQGGIENREKLFQRPETRDALRAQHRALYEAVMAGDPEAAGNAAEAHIHYTHRALREIRASEVRLEVSLRRLGGGSARGRRTRS